MAAFAALLALPLLSACPDTHDIATGELGNGSFEYRCVSGADSTCQRGVRDLPFVIAVGGRFGASFRDDRGRTLNVTVAPNDVVERFTGGFLVKAPGLFPLLAMDAEGHVVDFLHVEGEQTDQLFVSSQANETTFSTTLRIPLGVARTFSAQPFSRNQLLRGALDLTWRSLDEALVIGPPDTEGKVSITSKRTGSFGLEIDVAGRTFPFTVLVGGGAFEDAGWGDAGLEWEDAGTPTSLDGAIDAGARSNLDAGVEP